MRREGFNGTLSQFITYLREERYDDFYGLSDVRILKFMHVFCELICKSILGVNLFTYIRYQIIYVYCVSIYALFCLLT